MKPSDVFEKALKQARFWEQQAERLAVAMAPLFEPENPEDTTDAIHKKDKESRGLLGMVKLGGGNGK